MRLAEADGGVKKERIVERRLAVAASDALGCGVSELVGFSDGKICECESTIERRA